MASLAVIAHAIDVGGARHVELGGASLPPSANWLMPTVLGIVGRYMNK
jgi:hypothetical protein